MSAKVLVVAFQLSQQGGTSKRLFLWSQSIFNPQFSILYSNRNPAVHKQKWDTETKNYELLEIKNTQNKIYNYLRFIYQVVKTLQRGNYTHILPVGTASEVISFISKSIYFSKSEIVIYRAGPPVPVKLQNTLKGNFLHAFLRIIYKRSKKLVAINESLRGIIINEFGVKESRVAVVPISVTLDSNQAKYLDNQTNLKSTINFGVLSRLTPEKGVQFIISAFANLDPTELVKTKIFVFGEGQYRKDLEQMTSESGLDKHIFFRGWNDNQFEALSKIDCLLVGSKFEGTPRSILEAGLLNIPTISTAVGGIPAIIEHDQTGWLYPYSDADSLTILLKNVIGEPNKLVFAGKSMNSFVLSKFNLQAEAAEIRNVLELR